MTATDIAARVATHYRLDPAILTTKTRTPRHSEARHVLIALLAEAGQTPTAIGHLLGRDHSTVLSSIARAHSHHADTLAALRLVPPPPPWPPGKPPPPHLLDAALAAWSAEHAPRCQQPALTAYLCGELCRTRRSSGILGASGLVLLATHPVLRGALVAWLEERGLGWATQLLRMHLRQVGREGVSL